MGLRGPIPKEEGARIRRNADYRPVTHLESEEREAPFLADESWHPLAASMFDSFERSAQSALFEESDWAKLYFLCETLSRELKPQFIGFQESVEVIDVDGRKESHLVKKPKMATVPIKGASLSAINNMLTTLLATEADRRRWQVEIKRGGSGEQEQTAGEKVMDNVVNMFKKEASGDAPG